MEEVDRIASVKKNFRDKPKKDEVMEKVSVETFGEDYSDPETI